MTEPSFFHIGLAVILLAAALSDIRRLTIPNSLPLAAAGLFAAYAVAGPDDVALPSHLASFGLIGGIALLLFSAGLWGGGDAKLSMAAALWFPLDQVGHAALLVALAGFGLGATLLGVRRLAPVHRPSGRFAALREPGGPMPYGPAIAFGTLAALLVP